MELSPNLYIQQEFEPLNKPTPLADQVNVRAGYIPFDAAYLQERAPALFTSESRQSLSGITYETPVADSVEAFLRMSPPAQRLLLEYTGGHLTYNAQRDR